MKVTMLYEWGGLASYERDEYLDDERLSEWVEISGKLCLLVAPRLAPFSSARRLLLPTHH